MKRYYAKLLLFGEHIIVNGGQGLAVPFPQLGGYWSYTTEKKKADYQQNMPSFLIYLQELKAKKELKANLDLENFQTELKKGIYFDCTIPTGYGLGSSGALCAAIYDRFGTVSNANKLLQIKQELAQLESFFHGSSSGIDPLICYLEQAILIKNKQQIQTVSIPKIEKNTFFLLDTHIQRSTSPFVQLYLKKCETRSYQERLEIEFLPMNEEAIEAMLQGHQELLSDIFHQISHFQYRYFQEMIPSDFRAVWLDGLSSTHYKLKLCGAGGGGFLLGYSNDFERTKVQLKDYSLTPIDFRNSAC